MSAIGESGFATSSWLIMRGERLVALFALY
jgi:hypothetical protein